MTIELVDDAPDALVGEPLIRRGVISTKPRFGLTSLTCATRRHFRASVAGSRPFWPIRHGGFRTEPERLRLSTDG